MPNATTEAIDPRNWPRDPDTGMAVPTWERGKSMAGDTPERVRCESCWAKYGMTFFHADCGK